MAITDLIDVLDSVNSIQTQEACDQLIQIGSDIVPNLVKHLPIATTYQTLHIMTVLDAIGNQQAVYAICDLLSSIRASL